MWHRGSVGITRKGNWSTVTTGSCTRLWVRHAASLGVKCRKRGKMQGCTSQRRPGVCLLRKAGEMRVLAIKRPALCNARGGGAFVNAGASSASHHPHESTSINRTCQFSRCDVVHVAIIWMRGVPRARGDPRGVGSESKLAPPPVHASFRSSASGSTPVAVLVWVLGVRL